MVKFRRFFSYFRWLICIPIFLLSLVFFNGVPGFNFSGLVCLSIIAVILCYNCIHLLGQKHPQPAKILHRVMTTLLSIFLVVITVTGCFIVKASLGDPQEETPYIIVLGAKVRNDGPSRSLQERINGAYDYLTAHPDVIAIVSGGQGPDEPMTEAKCMADELIAMGIDEKRIWLEDQATSTWENLQFSLNLIEERTGSRPEKIAILSSEYHLFRASLLAKRAGVEFIGVPATTQWLAIRINYFLREIAGVWHYIILGGKYT